MAQAKSTKALNEESVFSKRRVIWRKRLILAKKIKEKFDEMALLLDQRPFQLTCAHDRSVIEVTVLGSLAKRFHAVQQASRIAS
jgi:hypothetical protein